MVAHGTLFSTPLVRALRKRQKTVTRRLIAPTNVTIDGPTCPKSLYARLDFSRARVDPGPSPAGNPGPYLKVMMRAHPDDVAAGRGGEGWETERRVYPRVSPKDVLWTKETWQRGGLYKADWHDDVAAEMKWRSALLMPRSLCRLELDVTAVRIERLQQITIDEIAKEGVMSEMHPPATANLKDPTLMAKETWHQAFTRGWDGLHGEGSWARNPWVLVYEFEVREVAPKGTV